MTNKPKAHKQEPKIEVSRTLGSNTLVIKGALWRVYFQSMHDHTGTPEDRNKRMTSCIIVAVDATDAMKKLAELFPNERVSMLTDMDKHWGSDVQPRVETIIA